MTGRDRGRKSKQNNLKRKADSISKPDAPTAACVEDGEHVSSTVVITADTAVSDHPFQAIDAVTEELTKVTNVISSVEDPTLSEALEDEVSNQVTIAPQQVDRVIHSMPVDTDAPADNNQTSKNPYDSIRYCIISNDGSHDHLVKLIGLKSLFAKMLPKMPKDYIVRLVMDRRHKSLAILSDDPSVQGGDDEIIGGICYRPYSDMRFAEIAFCAVSMNQQVKV